MNEWQVTQSTASIPFNPILSPPECNQLSTVHPFVNKRNNLHPLDLGWCAREPHLIGNPMLLIGFDEEYRLILLMKSHTINLTCTFPMAKANGMALTEHYSFKMSHSGAHLLLVRYCRRLCAVFDRLDQHSK